MSTGEEIGEPRGEPRSAAVTVITTEHFTLQGARAATIAESTGRATMFLTSVSGGLVVTAANVPGGVQGIEPRGRGATAREPPEDDGREAPGHRSDSAPRKKHLKARDVHAETGRIVGIKPAGGIRQSKQAVQYLVVLYETLGVQWMTPDLFRFGASTLLNDVLMQIRKERTGRYQSGDYFTID